jgi:sugar phosphate isomerase/epimerase
MHRIFALAAEAGFDGIESMIDRRWDTRDAAYLRRLSAEFNLPVGVLHSPFLPDVDAWPTDQLGRLEHTLAVARELSVPFVVTHLPYRARLMTLSWFGPKPWRKTLPLPSFWRGPYFDLLNSSGRLAQLEAESGVTIGVENMPARRFWGRRLDPYWFNHADDLLRFPHLTLDTTHLGTWGLDPVAVYEKLKGRVRHIHLSNFANGVEHRTPADGELDLRAFLRTLAQNKYDGTISVEGEPAAYHADDEAQCLAELRRALDFCRENLA